jgi:hypothetical protein
MTTFSKGQIVLESLDDEDEAYVPVATASDDMDDWATEDLSDQQLDMQDDLDILEEDDETGIEPTTDDEILEIVEDIDAIPTPEEVSEYEVNPIKRKQLLEYAQSLDLDKLIALNETLKLNVGPTSEIVDILAEVRRIQYKAETSNILQARNKLAALSLEEYNKIAQRVLRLVGGAKSDDPINSLRIDNTLGHIKTLNTDLQTLSMAIYHMAELVGLKPIVEEDMPIDIQVLVQILLEVGHSVKTWAATYQTSRQFVVAETAKSKLLETKLKDALKSLEDFQKQSREADTKRQDSLIRRHSYYVMNYSGFLIGSMVEQDDFGNVRLSPSNVAIVNDPTEAIELTTLEEARLLLDTVMTWTGKFKMVADKFANNNVNPKTLFIGQLSMNKVEG